MKISMSTLVAIAKVIFAVTMAYILIERLNEIIWLLRVIESR